MTDQYRKYFMTLAALVNGSIGLLISFFPHEVAHLFNWEIIEKIQTLPFKALGAAIFGFGVLNYLKRHSKLGGIYGRPTVMSNAFFHTIIGIQFIEVFNVARSPFISIITAAHLLLASGFMLLYFKNPVVEN